MTGAASTADTIRSRVAASHEEAVAFLQALVQLPTENPPGHTAEAVEWVAPVMPPTMRPRSSSQIEPASAMTT